MNALTKADRHLISLVEKYIKNIDELQNIQLALLVVEIEVDPRTSSYNQYIKTKRKLNKQIRNKSRKIVHLDTQIFIELYC